MPARDGGVDTDTIAPLGQNAFNLIAMAVTKLASKKEKLPPLNKKYLCTSMPIDSLEEYREKDREWKRAIERAPEQSAR